MATKVVFDDGREVKFMERMPKRAAISQAKIVLEERRLVCEVEIPNDRIGDLLRGGTLHIPIALFNDHGGDSE